MAADRPSISIVPASGTCAPPSTLINVLLPAPFSPSKSQYFTGGEI